jgi:ribosomal protein S14
MTTSDAKKVFKQLQVKPAKLEKFKKHNLPKKRTTGFALRKCSLCGRNGAFIRKYGINTCRQCFRLNAKAMGFKKYT